MYLVINKFQTVAKIRFLVRYARFLFFADGLKGRKHFRLPEKDSNFISCKLVMTRTLLVLLTCSSPAAYLLLICTCAWIGIKGYINGMLLFIIALPKGQGSGGRRVVGKRWMNKRVVSKGQYILLIECRFGIICGVVCMLYKGINERRDWDYEHEQLYN